MAVDTWTSPVSGDWNVAANWSEHLVPIFAEEAVIGTLPQAYTVTVSSADQADTLILLGSNAELVENAGSLSLGDLLVESGLASLNEVNTIGNVAVSAGELAFGNAGALGTGTVTMIGGELLGTTNETLTNALSFSGTSTIAAAHGTTLNENASSYSVAADTTLDIGLPGEDGTILWHNNATGEKGADATVDVEAGTLKAADDQLDFILNDNLQTAVAVGATIDIAGFDSTIGSLTGGGALINSGAAATLTLDGANYSVSIGGSLSVDFEADASLAGVEDYTGSTTLEGTASVTNGVTYDLVGNENINGTTGNSFINGGLFVDGGLFEKTGGGGVSAVTTNFINDGTLNVLSGSIEFSGGFTNNGVIHGLVTKAKIARLGEPFEVTVSAPVASDFNGDTLSDILLQNANTGQASIWDMDGNARTGGGAVSSNPGPNWKAIGTGDFDGDGHADILWQNANGQASIWEMNGNTLIGGGAVSPNPGPSWTAVGTGDFNGDGLADILWQNTSTGQASIWEMNGNARSGGGALSVNAGPAWKAIGSGDFNGDGFSDILFQNTSTGQVSIWEMDGNQRIGGGALSINPGPAWKAIGTGDFNDDGLADILFQNTSTGQVSIWEMDGTTRIGGGAVSVNPGPDWKAVGTGDFNGDGHSDILFQNTSSGQSSIWEMDGTGRIGGGVVSANPGTSWRAVGA